MAAAATTTSPTAATSVRPGEISITFCHTCGFRFKAQWLVKTLTELWSGSGTTITLKPVAQPLGCFVVKADGRVIYEKSRSFHPSEPQPTPAELGRLVTLLGPTPRPLDATALAEARNHHAAQIKAGPSFPWGDAAQYERTYRRELERLRPAPPVARQIATAAGGEGKAMALQTLIAENAVVLVGAPGCGYCARAKAILRASGVDFKFHELAGGRGGAGRAERDALDSLAGFGPRTVPYLWVNGKYAGGCNDGPEPWMGARRLVESGRLTQMLAR